MPHRIRGISTLRYTDEEMTVPRLSDNGELIEGWVKRPSDGWSPSDLLWLPPSATKSTDIDGIGRIVAVTEGLGDLDWIRAQLDRRAKYLDVLKSRVRSGALKLTAALAKFLGLDEDGAQLVAITGPTVYGKSAMAAAKSAVEEGRRLAGYPVDPDTGLPDIGATSTDARVRAIASVAARRFAETGDADVAMAEIRAAVARTVA